MQEDRPSFLSFKGKAYKANAYVLVDDDYKPYRGILPQRFGTDEREKKERNAHDSQQRASWIIFLDGLSSIRLELNAPITGVKRIRPAGTDRSGAVVAR